MTTPKCCSRLRRTLDENTSGRLDVIVVLQGGGDPDDTEDELELAGLLITSKSGPIITGAINVASVPALAALSIVRRIEQSREVYPEVFVVGCPTCEGRTGPETIFESMCEPHFAAAPRPSRQEIREAMERGRRAMEEVRQANRYRRIRR